MPKLNPVVLEKLISDYDVLVATFKTLIENHVQYIKSSDWDGSIITGVQIYTFSSLCEKIFNPEILSNIMGNLASLIKQELDEQELTLEVYLQQMASEFTEVRNNLYKH